MPYAQIDVSGMPYVQSPTNGFTGILTRFTADTLYIQNLISWLNVVFIRNTL